MKTDEMVLSRLGIVSLNDMQNKMIANVDEGNHVMLLSPTGSGKTLAYLLPLCHQINVQWDFLQAVVVVPTRELALQSQSVLSEMKNGIRSLCVYGGRPTMEEHRKIKEIKPHIVFATPGRLNDHISKANLLIDKVKILVLDEFDKCLEMGFQDELFTIVNSLTFVNQYLLTSATNCDELPDFIDKKLYSISKKLCILNYIDTSDSLTNSRLEIKAIRSKKKDKLDCLLQLLSFVKGVPTIVFVSHRESAERVGQCLKEHKFTCEIYHGGLEQEWRERALFKYRNGSANILVATDLASRGLDIPETEAVIHYHLPMNREVYVHRSGRTARWESEGTSYFLLGPEEDLPDYVEEVSVLDVEDEKVCPVAPLWTTLYIGKGKKDKLSKMDVVGFLCKKGGLEMKEIGKIEIGPHYAYVAVSKKKIKCLLSNVAGEKIKGLSTIIEEMRK